MTSPSIPMLERASRAVCRASHPLCTDGYVDRRWRDHTPQVVACLSALIPPSEEMVAAGILQHQQCTDNGTTDAACVAEHVFTAMVQAVLTEGPTTP